MITIPLWLWAMLCALVGGLATYTLIRRPRP